MNTTEKKTRAHTHEIEIAAPADAVWKAISDAEELIRWFPLEAQVEPGAGGVIRYRWGDMEGACRIESWEPPHHLRTSWMAFDMPKESAGEVRLAVDWFVEGRGGRTVLRLVHSGFGSGREWDTEYDGTRRGWEFELRSLRQYLERHRSQVRHALWVRRPVDKGADVIWSRLTGSDGLLREGRLSGIAPGQRYAVTFRNGDQLEGSVEIQNPPQDFAGSVDNLGQGLFRIGYDTIDGKPEVSLWLSTWNRPQAESVTMQQRWTEMLQQLFP